MTATRSGHPTRTRFSIGLLALFVVSTLVWLLAWATIPALLGWKPVAITSGSMAPATRSGDIVVAAPHTGAGLGPGTVIVFQDPTGDGLVTHRIVDVAPTGEYITAGDANRPNDSTPVQPGQVVGVGRLLVPLVGNPWVWAWEDRWTQLILAAVVALAAGWCSRWALLDRFDPWKMPPPDRESGSRQKPRPRRTLPEVFKVFLPLLAIGLIFNATPARSGFAATATNTGNSVYAATSFGGISQIQLETAATVGNASSITASYPSSPTESNLLVLVHHYRQTQTVTLPPGWTLAVTESGSEEKITIAYKIAGAAEGSDVTVSVSAAKPQTMTIFEYTGIDTSSPLDQTTSNFCNSNGSSCSTGTSPATSVANELLIAAVGLRGTSGGWGNTWTNGFTQQSTIENGGDANAAAGSSTADQIVSSIGTFETTESWTTGRRALAAMATFKAAP